MKLTPQQKDLLIAIVDAHLSDDGAPFIFVHNRSGRNLCYADGRSIAVRADELDFRLLAQERLITFDRVSGGLRGKATQLGIVTVASFSREGFKQVEEQGRPPNPHPEAAQQIQSSLDIPVSAVSNLASLINIPVAKNDVGNDTNRPRTWRELAKEAGRMTESAQTLRADWMAHEGCEEAGLWLFAFNRRDIDDERAAFGLFSADVIERLGMHPKAVPHPLQHDPRWAEYCRLEEDVDRRAGKTTDLSNAVPYGLGEVDEDAVDSCTHAWLEVLRKENVEFKSAGQGTRTFHGKTDLMSRGRIADVWAASRVYCLRRARDEIANRLVYSLPAKANSDGFTEVSAGSEASEQARPAKPDRGNLDLLRGTDDLLKRVVTVSVAMRFGGVTRRAIEKAVRKGPLQSEGEGPNRRIVVKSLLDYFPPEK